MTEFRVLGPVEIWAAGQAVDAGQPQQRLVLAALLADAGRSVTFDSLIERVWGPDPPDGARTALRAHVSRIRRVLEWTARLDAAPVELVRRGGGYAIEVDPHLVDLHRVRELVRQSCGPGRALADRAASLRQAAQLWRGEPLAGLTGDWPARVRQAWRQEYLDLVVNWADAELSAGNAGSMIGPLTELAGDHPLFERLATMLMRALAAVGRPAEALEHYTRVRRQLADEVGADPGAELQAAQQAILRGEPDPSRPAVPRTTVAPTVTASVVPALLPADVPGFAGRAGHLARLDDRYAATSRGPGTTAVVCALSGPAGVGKTALAIHWAHRVRDRFPDGQLYVDLRGFDRCGRTVSPGEALRGFLAALGVGPERMPDTLDAQAGLYRSLLVGRRILVVLDNARDADQVRPLLPATATVAVVVTSRSQLAALVAADGAQPLALDLLSPGEAYDLLALRLGTRTVAAEPRAVAQIVAACARLPLALTVAAARAQLGFPLGALAAELDEESERLEALDAGDAGSDVRAVFSWSLNALTVPAARLFRLLGLHPGPDVSVAAAAALTGLPAAATRRLLTELTRASLLAEPAPGRYTFHDLLRAYAAGLAHAHDAAADRRAAETRLLDHYVHTAHASTRLLDPHRDAIPVPLGSTAPDARPQRPADPERAMAWLTVEHPVLLATIRHAADAGYDTHAWQLAWSLDSFLHRRGPLHDLTVCWRAALAAARRLDDPTALADAHRRLARAYTHLGRHADARGHLERALDVATRAADRVGQARTHHDLAYLWERLGRPDKALGHSGESLALHHAGGNRAGQAHALNSVGWYHALLGDHVRAFEHCRQALALHREHGDRAGEASTWDSLGYAHQHLGEHSRAVDCYLNAVRLCRDLGNRYYEADTLGHLGDAYRGVGDVAAAHAVWAEALAILVELDHRDAEVLREKLDALS